MDYIPFSTFEGYLRCLRRESLSDIGVAALQFAFPGFLDGEPTPEFQRRMNDLAQKVDYVHIEHGPPRRFAGDDGFPRGRYYSVARDASGKDGFTLQKELMAYLDIRRTGWVVVADLSDERDARWLGPEYPTRNALAILMQDSKIQASQTAHFKAIVLPLSNDRIRIENCIDLRKPETQRWFFETFRNGVGKLMEKPLGNNIDSFWGMLPTLLWPQHGGGLLEGIGGITRAIGMWMRLNGVSALIYPSARVDVAVRVINGEVTDWRGWNLVDYRESGLPYNGKYDEMSNFFMFDLHPWAKSLPYPVNIKLAPADCPYVGSWDVLGNEEGQMIRYRETLAAILTDEGDGARTSLPQILAQLSGGEELCDSFQELLAWQMGREQSGPKEANEFEANGAIRR